MKSKAKINSGRVNIRMPVWLIDKSTDLADKKGVSFSEWVRDALKKEADAASEKRV